MRFKQGFTLIEVMITVAIIAILAAIAVPNYTDYVTRSKFTEAHGMLADLRVKMEQYYMDNRRYSTTTGGGTCGIPGGNTPTVPGAQIFHLYLRLHRRQRRGRPAVHADGGWQRGTRSGRDRLHPQPRECARHHGDAASWRPRATPPTPRAGC